MRKAMTLLALFVMATSAPFSWGDELPSHSDQYAMVHVPMPPVMMLPGMRALPPMTGNSAEEALPQPLISDVINAPNPFDSRKGGLDGQTQIAYRLDKNVPVTITIYDLFGLRVRRWEFSAGQNGGRDGVNNFWWDGTNEAGQKVSKGGYLAQIEIELPGAVASVIRKIGVIH